jgi:hypothetical protein
LAAARARGQAHAPSNYDVDIASKEEENPEPGFPEAGRFERCAVHVRQGRITAVACNGKPVAAARFANYGVDALFDQIDRFLRTDNQPGGPRTYAHAKFDEEDGHPLHYVRRVMGSRQRLEITVQLHKVPEPNDSRSAGATPP